MAEYRRSGWLGYPYANKLFVTVFHPLGNHPGRSSKIWTRTQNPYSRRRCEVEIYRPRIM